MLKDMVTPVKVLMTYRRFAAAAPSSIFQPCIISITKMLKGPYVYIQKTHFDSQHVELHNKSLTRAGSWKALIA